MYKTILIPIDIANLDKGKSMIDVATALTGKDTQIILLNVVEEIPNWAAAELPQGILDKSHQTSVDEMNAIAKSSGTEMEVEVRMGHSYKTILEVAEEKSVDLVIIASHRPGLQDYFLGSTAAKVVRHAKCSVLVTR
ncbi:MAG: universal stress protein [Gammaproteobacteria bacterium]